MKKKNILLLVINMTMSLFAVDIKIITNDGYAKENSIIYSNGVLRLDHINSKINDIVIGEDVKVRKVYFEFVDLTEASESFWNSFDDTEIFIFVYAELQDFDFIKHLKNAKAISFPEMNYIKGKNNIDLSSNEELEYFEIHYFDISTFYFSGEKNPNLKYLVLFNSYFSDDVYENIIKYFGKDVYFVISKEQEKMFIDSLYYDSEEIIEKLWEFYEID